jgi:AAA+ superfamily predicted ATPase
MVLPESLQQSLQRVLRNRGLSKLRSHGLHPRRNRYSSAVGYRQTMTASALAGELGILLFVVRLTRSYEVHGETAASCVIFDAAASTESVYFFDEFDAIGSQRGMANDVGEIRRILNSFLLMIEQDDSNSVIVAATNHPDILDEALFRRFDDVVEYHVPSTAEVQALLRMRLAVYVKSKKDLADPATRQPA